MILVLHNLSFTFLTAITKWFSCLKVLCPCPLLFYPPCCLTMESLNKIKMVADHLTLSILCQLVLPNTFHCQPKNTSMTFEPQCKRPLLHFKFIILHKKAGLTEMFPHNDWNDMNAPSFLHWLWSTKNTSKLYLHCLSFYSCSNCHSETQTQWDLMLSLHALRKFVL